MAANVDAMVTEAIRSFKSGKKADARALLEKATDLDPHHEKAWMWLSAVVDSPDDQRICLENVLFINPNNANARKGLDYLAEQTGSQPTTSTQNMANDDLPDTNQSSGGFTDPPPTAPPEPSTDDYAIPTSSASAAYDPASQPTADQYDDWVVGLGLGSDPAQTVEQNTAQQQPKFEFDDDLFANTFGTDEESGFSDAYETGSPFSTEDASTNQFANGPFDADALLEDFSVADINFEETVVQSDADDLDTLLADLDGEAFGTSSGPEPVMSPAPPASEQNAAESRRKRRKTSQQPKVTTDEFYLGGEDIDTDDPAAYFRMIPDTIKPTNLPGQGKKTPVMLYVGFVVLILANMGAAGVLLLNMSG